MKRVVITGMGVITPIGCDVDTFRKNLFGGVNGIDEITRFDTTDFKVKLAAEVKDFDPEQYMDKHSVRKTDRFVQYALAAASQAVEDSKIKDNIDSDRFGVYFGSGIGGFETFTAEHENLLNRGCKRVSPMFIPKMISNMAAGNIAIQFGAKGPCISISTACATGTSAIGEAYRAILGGYADALIAGGVESTISPLAVAGFTNCMALSTCTDKNRASIPFDKERRGFVMGEGAGAVIVEEYEHALKRGASIYAEIVGYGSTCDAYHITAPDVEGDSAAKAILDSVAGISNLDLSKTYFNAHGTSTPLNDKTETNAIKKAFGDKAYELHISSTKSMTGHLLGAAGAVEAIASIFAINDNTVPPTIGYREKDEECDLDYTVNKALKTEINFAISNSLGFGGHNACIALARAEK
ncbi:MAG: beta-ketoacyl-ACP synthase II [Clostridiales bacterium]|nr:beta-ketoacyl-ACP synthase II [Clostridiales bacterium]